MLLVATAMFGVFFFLTIFVQNVLGYSPLRSGVAFLRSPARSSCPRGSQATGHRPALGR